MVSTWACHAHDSGSNPDSRTFLLVNYLNDNVVDYSMARNKTKTIKERAIYIYVPTVEQKQDWDKRAKKEGLKLSRWIVNIVNEALLEREEDTRSRKELEREISSYKEEIAKLREKIRQLTILKDRYEEELRKYRAQPFLDEHFEGKRKYSNELIELLRNTKDRDDNPKVVNDEEIFRHLGISFKETEAIKAISKQLELLEAYRIIESTPKGWRWIG